MTDNTTIGYHWDPIEDLPSNWGDLRNNELRLTFEAWQQERRILKDPEKFRKLHEELANVWAIETGLIERLYPSDRGTTQTFIAFGLAALENLRRQNALSTDAVLLIRDQRAAIDFIFDFVSQRRDLSSSYIKELHQGLTTNQPFVDAIDTQGKPIKASFIRGAWKTLPNNPRRPDGLLHEYCPPEFVQDEIDLMITLHKAHLKEGVPPEIESAWLHHRFTQIHPFQDGNGRVARGIATMVFLQKEYLPLVVRDDPHREPYLESLESADAGDLAPLIALFSRIQMADLESGIEVLRQLRGTNVVALAASAAGRAKARRDHQQQTDRKVTDELVEISKVRLSEVAAEIKTAFSREDMNLEVLVEVSSDHDSHYWHSQIVNVAKASGYFADLQDEKRWTRLRIRFPGEGAEQANIVLSFHKRGYTPGLYVSSAFLSISLPQSEAGIEIAWHSEDPFNYSASHLGLRENFHKWLESVVEGALNAWQARI